MPKRDFFRHFSQYVKYSYLKILLLQHVMNVKNELKSTKFNKTTIHFDEFSTIILTKIITKKMIKYLVS